MLSFEVYRLLQPREPLLQAIITGNPECPRARLLQLEIFSYEIFVRITRSLNQRCKQTKIIENILVIKERNADLNTLPPSDAARKQKKYFRGSS